MAETLTFQFTPSKQDYINSSRSYFFQYQLKSKLLLLNLGFLAVFEVCLLCAVANDTFIRHPLVGLLLLPIPVLFFLFFLIAYTLVPLAAGRQAQRSQERLLSEMRWQLSENEIRISSAFMETRLDWGTFQKLVETKHYFFLIYSANKALTQFIPRRTFPSPNEETAFRQMVARNIGRSNAVAQTQTSG